MNYEELKKTEQITKFSLFILFSRILIEFLIIMSNFTFDNKSKYTYLSLKNSKSSYEVNGFSFFYLSLVGSQRSVVRWVKYQEMIVFPAILGHLRQHPLCRILNG